MHKVKQMLTFAALTTGVAVSFMLASSAGAATVTHQILIPDPPEAFYACDFRGFAARGSGRDLAVSRFGPRFRGFEVSRGWRRTAMSCVRRFGSRFQGLATISSEGEPVGGTPRRVKYVARTAYKEGGAEKVVPGRFKCRSKPVPALGLV